MIHWQQVLGSSNVAAIAYDEEKQECWVKFLNGAVYVYEGVGPGIWDEFRHTSSKGRYVQIQLRRAHKFRKEDGDGGPDSGGKVDPGAAEEDRGVV